MLRRALIVNIRRPSNSVSGYPDPAVSIQCVNVRDPMYHGLWFQGMAGLFLKVHPTVRVEIATGTVG